MDQEVGSTPVGAGASASVCPTNVVFTGAQRQASHCRCRNERTSPCKRVDSKSIGGLLPLGAQPFDFGIVLISCREQWVTGYRCVLLFTGARVSVAAATYLGRVCFLQGAYHYFPRKLLFAAIQTSSSPNNFLS